MQLYVERVATKDNTVVILFRLLMQLGEHAATLDSPYELAEVWDVLRVYGTNVISVAVSNSHVCIIGTCNCMFASVCGIGSRAVLSPDVVPVG